VSDCLPRPLCSAWVSEAREGVCGQGTSPWAPRPLPVCLHPSAGFQKPNLSYDSWLPGFSALMLEHQLGICSLGFGLFVAASAALQGALHLEGLFYAIAREGLASLHSKSDQKWSCMSCIDLHLKARPVRSS
jgi:hypothetical protein